MGNKKYYTYRYAYPQGFIADDGTDLSGIIFYVGKGTVNVYAPRMDAHELEARKGCDCRKCCAIRSIWEKGMEVDKAKMTESHFEHDVLQHEKDAIQLYSSAHLTNYQYNTFERIKKPSNDQLGIYAYRSALFSHLIAGHRRSNNNSTRWDCVLGSEEGSVVYDKHWITVLDICWDGPVYCVKIVIDGKPFTSRERLLPLPQRVDDVLYEYNIPLVGWQKSEMIVPVQQARQINAIKDWVSGKPRGNR